jgi:hypothetical protein
MSPQPYGCGIFGLWMGMGLEEFTTPVRADDLNEYSADTVPEPHPEFVSYGFRLAPETGLTSISASGRPIPSSPDGSEVRERFESLCAEFEQKYGPRHSIDHVDEDPRWLVPELWMRSVREMGRICIAVWRQDAGHRLPADLRDVILMARAHSETEGSLFLTCFSANHAQEEFDPTEFEDPPL